MAGASVQTAFDWRPTAGRAMSLARFVLRASPSKERSSMIDAAPKPTRTPLPAPIRARAPRWLLTAWRREKMAANPLASYELKLAQRDRSKRTELVSSSTTDDATTDFTYRAF